MRNNLKDMLNNIPLPDSLDENIEMGFNKGKKNKKKFGRIISVAAASIIVIFGIVNIIGLDKVEAAIKQALQYVPGYNLTIDKDKGKVLALEESVLYEKDNIYIKILAGSKLEEDINISIESNYNVVGSNVKDMEIALKDEKGKTFPTKNWSMGSGGKYWQGDYNFKVDGKGKDYILIIDEMEIPFKLEETKEVDDFLELGPYDEDKGISIVAIKKPMEDKIKISLLNKSKEWTIEDYPFKGIDDFDQFRKLGIEKSMYLLDLEGNKIFPTIPSSYGNLMSDFYFDTLDSPGLKLVLPYLKIGYYDAKTEKIKLKIPNNDEEIKINKTLNLGKFELEVVNVKKIGEEVLINLDIKDLKDEVLNDLRVGGISGYSMYKNKNTGYMEIGINVGDIGKRFSIYFASPTSILKGNWEILLN